MKNIKYITMICFVSLVFIACGGSGSTPSTVNGIQDVDNGDISSNTEKLSVSLGEDKTVNPNERVVLAPTIKNNNGAIKSYIWKEGNKTLGTTDGFIYRSVESGEHIVSLTIKDSAENSATDSVKIIINLAPSISISSSGSNGNNIKVGDSVTFNTNVENSAVAGTYQWFINGVAVSGQTGSTFTHVFTTAGSFTVSVEIRDGNGVLLATNSEVVTVLSSSNANTNTTSTPATTIDSLTQGLKAWYQFEDNANDSSGNGNHGEVFGNLTYVNSAVGKGAKFDGNSSIVLLQSETLKSFNDKFTLSFWTKYHYTKEGSKNVVVHLTNGLDVPLNGEAGFYNYSNKNGIDFRVGAWGDANTSSIKLPYDAVQTLEGQTEHLITFVVDGNSTFIYKDAVVAETAIKDNTYSISRLSSNWYIGSMGNVYYLDGIIDDMRLYNRALTGAEVQKLYDLKN